MFQQSANVKKKRNNFFFDFKTLNNLLKKKIFLQMFFFFLHLQTTFIIEQQINHWWLISNDCWSYFTATICLLSSILFPTNFFFFIFDLFTSFGLPYRLLSYQSLWSFSVNITTKKSHIQKKKTMTKLRRQNFIDVVIF